MMKCPTCRQPWQPEHRKCPQCARLLPLEAFTPHDGYCRECRKTYQRRYYLTVTRRRRGAAAA